MTKPSRHVQWRAYGVSMRRYSGQSRPSTKDRRDGAWINGLMTDRAKSFAYGAFLLNPYTRWDATTQTVTIFYLMSTGEPYQAVVMRSRIPVV
jgi:hypothetical protein